MADEAKPAEGAPQTPATTPLNTPPAGAPAPASPSPKAPPPEKAAAYKAYLDAYQAQKTTKQPAPTVKKTGANSYQATTPLTTSAAGSTPVQPVKPLTIGPNNPDPKRKPKITGISGKGVKKTGANSISIDKGIEFDTDAPLDFDAWDALNSARSDAAQNDAGYQDHLRDVAAANEMAADSGQEPSAEAMPYEDWLAAQQPAAALPESPNTPSSPANNLKPPQEFPAEPDLQGIPLKNAPATAQPQTAPNVENASPSSSEAAPNVPSAATPVQKAIPKASRPTAQPKQQAAPQATKKPSATLANTPKVVPANQANKANELAANKAKDRNANKTAASPQKAAGGFGGTKNNIKNAANQFNPINQASRAKDSIKDGINNASEPIKNLVNLPERIKLKKDIAADEKKKRVIEKETKKPLSDLKPLERKKRALHLKLQFLKFLRLVNLVLDFIGVGEITTVPLEVVIKASKKEDSEIKNKILKIKDGIKSKISEKEKLTQSIKTKYQKLENLSRVFKQKQQDSEQQDASKPEESAGGAEGTPWNAPSNFNQNVTNDNAAASVGNPVTGNPQTPANDNGMSPNEASQPVDEMAERRARKQKQNSDEDSDQSGLRRAA